MLTRAAPRVLSLATLSTRQTCYCEIERWQCVVCVVLTEVARKQANVGLGRLVVNVASDALVCVSVGRFAQ